MHLLMQALMLLWLCRCHGQSRLAGVHSYGSFRNTTASRGRWLQSTVNLAHEQLRQAGPQDNIEKLAVVFLVTDLERKDRDRIGMLRACLRLCAAHLFPNTPSSVYIFTHEPQMELVRQGLGEWMLPNVVVLATDRNSWVVPDMVGNASTWHSSMPIDYRLMGDWRLSYMPGFARQMGHRYVLQLDDDSYILSPVSQNLVQLFDTRKYVLAARQFQQDSPSVTWGLPELARYYLTTNKIMPATLFQFCQPPNMRGLYSRFVRHKLEQVLSPAELNTLGRMELPERGGWNRTILFGNCLMYSLEWWFRSEVSRFVSLCRASGGSFAYRWNEQGVIAMLWQIFVPREQFYTFEFGYAHRLSAEEALQKAGISSAR